MDEDLVEAVENHRFEPVTGASGATPSSTSTTCRPC
jgi:hypothetical protein